MTISKLMRKDSYIFSTLEYILNTS